MKIVKWIRFSVLLVVILGVFFRFAVQILAGCIQNRLPTYGAMKEQAEKAIKDVGGVGPLENETKVLLGRFHVEADWNTISNKNADCPTITKLKLLLSPYPHGGHSWIVKARGKLPAHVVIRFGSHRRYAYIWVFDPEHVPQARREGMEHIAGAVYFSVINE